MAKTRIPRAEVDPSDPTKPAFASSQDQLNQIPPAYRPTMTLSEAELKEMWANAKEWLNNPKALKLYAAEMTLVLLQLHAKRAMEPPGGRLGASVSAKSAREFVTIATKLIETIRDTDDKA